MGVNDDYENVCEQLRRAHEHIEWLEQEVSRLHRLLQNPWNWSDSFKTPAKTQN